MNFGSCIGQCSDLARPRARVVTGFVVLGQIPLFCWLPLNPTPLNSRTQQDACCGGKRLWLRAPTICCDGVAARRQAQILFYLDESFGKSGQPKTKTTEERTNKAVEDSALSVVVVVVVVVMVVVAAAAVVVVAVVVSFQIASLGELKWWCKSPKMPASPASATAATKLNSIAVVVGGTRATAGANTVHVVLGSRQSKYNTGHPW